MRGNDLRDFRSRWDLSQVSMAGHLGVSLRTVQRWESNAYPAPGMLWLALEELDRRWSRK